jgi:hypothetical protein
MFPIRNPIGTTSFSSFLGILIATVGLASVATAACLGDTCSLGGQLRAQAGDGLPIPISAAPALDGDVRWGQPGLIQATPSATIMQQSPAPAGAPSTNPRSLMLPPGALTYDAGPVSRGVIKSNANVLAVRTNLAIVAPHPGTTTMGAPAPYGPFGSATFSAGGRSGPSIVSWCAGLPRPTASFNPGCSAPDYLGYFGSSTPATPLTNGLVRFTKTRNQFGGRSPTRVAGTVQVFFNAGGLALGDLPCVWGATLNTAASPKVNPDCVVGLSVKQIANTVGPTPSIFSVGWTRIRTSPAQPNSNGVFTAHIGASGTILGYKTGTMQTITTGGSAMNPVPFAGQTTTSYGVPYGTGRLTISVTANEGAPTTVETFVRTGNDQRTLGGEGLVVMVGGAVSARSISGPNADRRWLTLNVPEPGSLAAGAAGIFALLGCHAWARRRSAL